MRHDLSPGGPPAECVLRSTGAAVDVAARAGPIIQAPRAMCDRKSNFPCFWTPACNDGNRARTRRASPGPVRKSSTVLAVQHAPRHASVRGESSWFGRN
ncbi:hypothetical protein C7S17_4868 [Burkholderia thailandensis]|nr:hypothetical protein [Burkholderia thailandensis]